jgi:CheY-like chemotaxis protein
MMPDLPRASSMKEFGPSVTAKDSGSMGGLVRKVSWQGIQEPLIAKSCSSFSTLHTEDHDAIFFKPKRRISFDERVSVLEFDSTSCVSLKDLEPASPVRPVPKIILCSRNSPDSSANLMVDVYPDCPVLPILRKPALTLDLLLRKEIRRILMVDPHDIFLQLFSKRLQEILPHVEILKAHSSEEALQILSTTTSSSTRFDIIITEERLSLFHKHKNGKSGSALLAHLRQHYPQQYHQSLLIMVSAHWQADHAAMAQSGADYCWSKAPPPVLHPARLEEMIHTLLHKRGQHDVAKEFMLLTSAQQEEED